MSMLAERKRKTKWVINPTKKPLWTGDILDSSGIKFGKELMEKMGWSAGKGLGIKEQGIHEPIKVPYKNDTKGMGFKGLGCNDDDWIEHQDEFTLLLSQLNNSNDKNTVKTSEIKSLEDKSKHSKARVHYQKFTRGKDLSKYSENDLACILGLNKSKKEKFELEEVTKTESKKNPNGEVETSFGVTTVYGGSLQDYFNKKRINKIKSNNFLKSTNELEDFNKNISETKTAFWSSKKEENAELGTEEKKHKKRKHKSEIENIDQNIICSQTEDINNSSVDKKGNFLFVEDENEEKKHKKRKHKSEVENTDQNIICSQTEGIENSSVDKKGNFLFVEDENEEKKHKKRKHKSEVENTDQNIICSQTEGIENSSVDKKGNFLFVEDENEEKKHKKRKHKSEVENIDQNIICSQTEDINNSSVDKKGNFLFVEDENEEKKHKKRKHKSEVENTDQNVICSQTEGIENSSVDKKGNFLFVEDENEEKKLKKRKHESKSESGFSNIGETEKSKINKFSEEVSEEKEERKRKSKKVETNFEEEVKVKKKNKNINENDSLDENKVQIPERIEKNLCLHTDLNEKNIKMQFEEKHCKKRKDKSKSEAEEIILVTENSKQNKELKVCEKTQSETNFEAEISEKEQFEGFDNFQTELNGEKNKKICKQKNKLSLEEKQKLKKKKKTCSDEYKLLSESEMNNAYKEEKSKRVYGKEFACAIQGEDNIKSPVKEMKYEKKKSESKPEKEEIYFGFTVNAINDAEKVILEKKEKKTKKRKNKSISEPESPVKKDSENLENDELKNLEEWKKERKKRKKIYFDDNDVISKTEINTLKGSETVLPTDLVCEAFENLENQYISSTKKHKKEKKERKPHEKKFERSIERKAKKQKASFGECKEGLSSSEYKKKEMKEPLLDDSFLKADINVIENEISEKKQSGKKKKEAIEKENKCSVKENSESKQENFCISELPERKSKKCENSEKIKTLDGEKSESGICKNFTEEKLAEDNKIIMEGNVKSKGMIRVNNEAYNGKYAPKTYTTEKVLDLICWADIKKFKGSNLGNVLGYGFKKECLKNT